MKQLLISVSLLLLQLFAVAQNEFIQQSFQLPFSNEMKSYYVKKLGTDYILNGDIIAGNTLQKTMLYQTNNHDRYIWPKGEIAIQIDESLTNRKNRDGVNMRKQALEAIDMFNRLTNLRLVARTNQSDYITIKFSPDTTYGGLSPVGRVGGEQVIWITALSAVRTYLHELMHSFGFYHEQSRHDRDLYVVVDTTKAIPDFRYSFQIEPGVTGTAYDYMSVMHYTPDAFAMKAGDITIRCKNGNKISDCNLGGFRLSDLDIAGINNSYFYNASLPRVEYKDYLIRKEEQQVKFKNQPSSGAVTKMTDQQLEEGMYKIKVNQTGKYLAIEGISKDNGARLVQWDYVDQANHKFYVKKIADGIYVISAVHSGRYINAAGQGTADGTPVIQWDYAAQDNVRWKLFYVTANQGAASGWVIQNKNSGTNLCLPSFGGANNGEALVIRKQEYNDGAPEAIQTFSFEKIGNLVFREQGLYENSPGMLKKVKQ
jgi:Astacin (Peptidase family M12A)/Ricin-type beta-trefoil lectin domain-like